MFADTRQNSDHDDNGYVLVDVNSDERTALDASNYVSKPPRGSGITSSNSLQAHASPLPTTVITMPSARAALTSMVSVDGRSTPRQHDLDLPPLLDDRAPSASSGSSGASLTLTLTLPNGMPFPSRSQSPTILSKRIPSRPSSPSDAVSPRTLSAPFPPSLPPSPSPSPSPLPAFSGKIERPPASTLDIITHFSARLHRLVVSLRAAHLWLMAYFLASASLTITNKYLLRSWFPFPWILTAVQMATAVVGTRLAAFVGAYRAVSLSPKRESIVYTSAIVFSCEMILSNISLKLMNVAFHLSVRALAPPLTLLLGILFFHQRTTARSMCSLLLVALGVGFTSHHLEWVSFGSILTFLSMVLASFKTIITNRLLYDVYHLHQLDLLSRIAPLGMTLSMLIAVWNGEIRRLWAMTGDEFTRVHMTVLALNGVISFALVVIGIAADKRVKGPSYAITGYAAQAFTIIASTFFFSLSLSFMNFMGVLLTLSGGVLYAHYDALDTAGSSSSSTLSSSSSSKLSGEPWKGKLLPD